MGTYGRNLGFRVPPMSENRQGRFASPVAAPALPLGCAVVADNAAGFTAALGLQTVKLAAAGAAPIPGESGILVYEYGPAAFAGFDPALTTYSDLGTAPRGAAVQLISGSYVKVTLTNTPASQIFLGNRTYVGRTMVAGMGATPTVTVGQYLIPGPGDDVNGYWTAQSSATGAWMIVTFVDAVRAQVEARMVF